MTISHMDQTLVKLDCSIAGKKQSIHILPNKIMFDASTSFSQLNEISNQSHTGFLLLNTCML